MNATTERLCEFLKVDYLRKHFELGFIIEWDEERGDKELPVAAGFIAEYIDEPRELAILLPRRSGAHEVYNSQPTMLEETEWLDCWSPVLVVTLPHQSRDEEQQEMYDQCMAMVAVMYTSEEKDVDVFVIHRLDDLYKVVLACIFKEHLRESRREKQS